MSTKMRKLWFLILVPLIGACTEISSSASWHYIEDPHFNGPCLSWQDNDKKKDGIYCRVYPTEIGKK